MPIRVTAWREGWASTADLERELVVGRTRPGASVDLDLSPDSGVSRRHARLFLDEVQGLWIEDLGSSNGTFVGAEDIRGKGPCALSLTDTACIGHTVLRFESALAPTITADARQVARDALLESVTVDPVERLELLQVLLFQTDTDALMQMIADSLLTLVKGASRSALLLVAPDTNELLLKAYSAREGIEFPIADEILTHRALDEARGFIWRGTSDYTFSPFEDHSATKAPSDATIHGQLRVVPRVETGMYAPLLWQNRALGVVCVDNPRRPATFDADDLRLLLTFAQIAAMAVSNQLLQDRVRRNEEAQSNLLRQFSPQVATRLLGHRGRLRMGGERSEVTILCSDVRGFTALSTSRPPEDVVELLNAYFERLTSVIFECDGTVDKYVGDAILAVFGSPEPDHQQYRKAVRAALRMQEEVCTLSRQRAARRELTCGIGIGVHCGEVLHGFIGSPRRMEFTVIGDAVNRASRYCDAARAGEVLISGELFQRVYNSFRAERTTIPTKHEGSLTAYRVQAEL